ncbi:hypothetical protein [Deinococcus ficus]|uniref:Uncharacterized protein n=1 Tax=Deinococcus ficus TaxID=317577 RepID=A0A221T370_9DEIO|nr:hypothetical protein [Deinococcus ficus]ASN83333.1 hypothetical protein DFI_19235 [Deinococcus ficus]
MTTSSEIDQTIRVQGAFLVFPSGERVLVSSIQSYYLERGGALRVVHGLRDHGIPGADWTTVPGLTPEAFDQVMLRAEGLPSTAPCGEALHVVGRFITLGRSLRVRASAVLRYFPFRPERGGRALRVVFGLRDDGQSGAHWVDLPDVTPEALDPLIEQALRA